MLRHPVSKPRRERNDVRTFTDLDRAGRRRRRASSGPPTGSRSTQERVNLFADATDDHQWIHVDEERAEAGPFGGTIAHGYLTLSLIPLFNSS